MMLPKSCLRLTFLLVFSLGSVLPDDQRSKDLTEDVISSLNRVLEFFKRDYRSINLDGIFGLRVAQGAFLAIINEVKDGQLNVEDSVLKQVKGLHNKASIIAQDALPFLRESSPEYFMKFKKQVLYPWSNFKPFTYKKLSKRQYKPNNRRNVINFDENTSDQCMTELTGTESGLDGGQPCHISDKCWRLITAKGAQGYTLTHQALFFQLGETQGCTPIFLKHLQKSNIKGGLEEIYNRICSDMYPEMTATEQKRTLDKSNYQKDLYMEQAMVCGSMGYVDFLSTERLRKILSWQGNDGCFGKKRDVYQDDDDDDDETDSEQLSETDVDDVGGQQSELIDKSDTDGTEKRDIRSPFGDVKKSLEYEYSQILRKPLSMRTMRSLLIEKELEGHVIGSLFFTPRLPIYKFKKILSLIPAILLSLVSMLPREEKKFGRRVWGHFFPTTADGCLSHITGVATGLLGVYLRWLLYSHDKPFQKHNEMDTKKSLQSQETEVYVNDNLVDAIVRKENQLEHQKKMRQDQMQSAHLMQMRRAAMLEKSGLLIEKNVEGKEGEGSVAWRVIVFGSIFLVLMVFIVKGFKGMPNMATMFTHTKKHTHVI